MSTLDEESSKMLEGKISRLSRHQSFNITINEPIDEFGLMKLRVQHKISKFSAQVPAPTNQKQNKSISNAFAKFFSNKSPTYSHAEQKKLIHLVRLGVPQIYRPYVYKYFLNTKNSHYDYYLSLQVEESVIQQISNDIDRTHPNIANFNTQVNLEALFRILKAQAARNSVIGYVQGMNFVAGLFLMVLPEAEAFECFSQFFDKFQQLWENKNSGTAKLTKFAQKMIPNACAPFTAYFLSFYQTFFPFKIALRIFDQIVAEGYKGLLRPSVALYQKCVCGIVCPNNVDFDIWFHQLSATDKINGVSILGMGEDDARQYLQEAGFSVSEEEFFRSVFRVKVVTEEVERAMNE